MTSPKEPGPVCRALISVSDKTGLVDFASQLVSLGVELLSTGGTAKLLTENQIRVTDVSAYTGFPEIMGGRVKTLHPKVHGGILSRLQIDEQTAADHGIDQIDLVAVNLYPFEQTVSKPGCSLEDAIENIDIGGPAMVRAAAKNHQRVTVIVDPADYHSIIKRLTDNSGCLNYAERYQLACKAFAHTAAYDGAIANYLGVQGPRGESKYGDSLHFTFHKKQELRYGENPHQSAAYYVDRNPPSGSIAAAGLIQGKPLSFNNIADADAALECVKQFEDPTCVIVKHANPCGVSSAGNLAAAYDAAFATDPTSAFGGIIAFNRTLTAELAKSIIDRQFVEVIIAPAIDDQAKGVLETKPNVRVMCCGEIGLAAPRREIKQVNGGILYQDSDLITISPDGLKTVTKRAPTDSELRDLLFAWKVAKFVKSNAIVYARNLATIGVGAGQMSRVYSARIAGIKAADENLEVPGSVMASDAFFPFRDGLDAAHAAGISAVIQPGGSMKDNDVIAAADEHGIAMVFTGVRHFRH